MADRIFELELTQAVYGGKVMGRHRGRPIFVPYAIPGERITARITEDKRSYANAEGVTLLTPSPDRVQPECPHFGPGRCGGCHLQHMRYDAQLRYKRDVVIDQMTRLGDVKRAERLVRAVIPSPDEWGYRSRASFHVAPDGRLGFVATDHVSIEPVDWCYILDPRAMSLLEALELDTTDITQLEVRVGSDGRGMIVVQTADDLAPALEADMPISVNLLLSDNEPVNLIGDSHTIYTVKGRSFRVTAGGFFQVNLPMAAVLVDLVLERLNLQGHESVLDLYAGVGLFSAFIAERAALVTVVESYPPAVTDADENLAEFEHIDLFEGGVAPVLEELASDGAGPYEAAVVDPPRAGLEPAVIDALAALEVPNLVYVSCDPGTLARDVKRLARHGYRLQHVQPVDMFPQTYHIECVAHFLR
ncbi:MAG: class I SAM-dependent RNA methyltransferase [Anaerolineae bacterium]